jgi:hypothetical protein
MKNCQDKSGNPYENLFDKLEDMLPSSISVTGYNWVLSRGVSYSCLSLAWLGLVFPASAKADV